MCTRSLLQWLQRGCGSYFEDFENCGSFYYSRDLWGTLNQRKILLKAWRQKLRGRTWRLFSSSGVFCGGKNWNRLFVYDVFFSAGPVILYKSQQKKTHLSVKKKWALF